MPTEPFHTAPSSPVRLAGTPRPQPDDLFSAFALHREPHVYAQLVEHYMPLVSFLAFKFSTRGEPLDDMRQVACIGLMKALTNFRPGGARFLSFACPTIIGEMKRHLRDRLGLIRIPRPIQTLRLKVSQASERLGGELGRPPRDLEIAEFLGVPVTDVLEASESAHFLAPQSIDTPMMSSETGLSTARAEQAGARCNDFEVLDLKLALHDALRVLQPRAQRAVLLSFYGGLTQREIARTTGVSQMQISRLLRRSLDCMRDSMTRPSTPVSTTCTSNEPHKRVATARQAMAVCV